METIKLNNGQAFEIIPMGIDANAFEKIRVFSFVSELGYGEIETAFNAENIGNIQYLSDHDELLQTYTDCIALKSLSKEFGKQIEDSITADVYSVVLTLI